MYTSYCYGLNISKESNLGKPNKILLSYSNLHILRQFLIPHSLHGSNTKYKSSLKRQCTVHGNILTTNYQCTKSSGAVNTESTILLCSADLLVDGVHLSMRTM